MLDFPASLHLCSLLFPPPAIYRTFSARVSTRRPWSRSLSTHSAGVHFYVKTQVGFWREKEKTTAVACPPFSAMVLLVTGLLTGRQQNARSRALPACCRPGAPVCGWNARGVMVRDTGGRDHSGSLPVISPDGCPQGLLCLKVLPILGGAGVSRAHGWKERVRRRRRDRAGTFWAESERRAENKFKVSRETLAAESEGELDPRWTRGQGGYPGELSSVASDCGSHREGRFQRGHWERAQILVRVTGVGQERSREAFLRDPGGGSRLAAMTGCSQGGRGETSVEFSLVLEHVFFTDDGFCAIYHPLCSKPSSCAAEGLTSKSPPQRGARVRSRAAGGGVGLPLVQAAPVLLPRPRPAWAVSCCAISYCPSP
nr:uncharacterized protein LOC129045662 [Mirounga angustirostris]XP_054362382.1 uncharacterized protein LOC129045662 [Mirounga angustirostris]